MMAEGRSVEDRPAPASTEPAGGLAGVRYIDRAIRDAFVYLDALDRRTLAGIAPPIMPSQYYALVALAAVPTQSLGQLAARLLCDKGNASGLVDRLQAIGLVDRRRDPADGRRVQLALTPAGHAVLAQTTQMRAAALLHALQSLAPEDLRATEVHIRELVGLLRAAVNAKNP
jgi:DNA-binding MarR family transcriptional regulator